MVRVKAAPAAERQGGAERGEEGRGEVGSRSCASVRSGIAPGYAGTLSSQLVSVSSPWSNST